MSLTPAGHDAYLRAWKKKMQRAGFTFAPDAQQANALEAANQRAMATAFAAWANQLRKPANG